MVDTMSSALTVVADIPKETLDLYLKSDAIAMDTELQGLRLQRDQVCLVQMADRNQNVCLVRPKAGACPNLTRLLTDSNTLKVFHYALVDVAFLRRSLGITVNNFACTKVMSKLVRTYASYHSLKELVNELVGIKLEKENQQTNWSAASLTPEQTVYAANDVLHLLKVYDGLKKMVHERGALPSGITADQLNVLCQSFLPTLVELILNGYGDADNGWVTSLFTH